MVYVVVSELRLLVLSYEYPPHVYGGAGVHVKYMVRELSKLVDHVEVRTVLREGAPEVEEEGNVLVRRYRAWGDPLARCPERFKPVYTALSLGLALSSEPVDADVAHYHTWYMALAGLLVKKLYGVKLVTTVHSLEPRRPWKAEVLGRGYEVSKWVEKQGVLEADKVIAVSEYMARDVVKLYGVPECRVVAIPNGIDVDLWRPVRDPRVLERYGVREPYVLFVGRLSKQKGVFTLLEAARKVREVRFVFVTGKPDEPGLEERFAREARGLDHVVWVNKVLGPDELIPLYTHALAFICPSVYEPFGIVNLEAMATGTPVIASRVGGIPEVVEDGVTGILVPPGDPDAIADAVRRLLEDPRRAQEMGRRGRERVLRKYAWSRIAERTLKVYEEVLGC